MANVTDPRLIAALNAASAMGGTAGLPPGVPMLPDDGGAGYGASPFAAIASGQGGSPYPTGGGGAAQAGGPGPGDPVQSFNDLRLGMYRQMVDGRGIAPGQAMVMADRAARQSFMGGQVGERAGAAVNGTPGTSAIAGPMDPQAQAGDYGPIGALNGAVGLYPPAGFSDDPASRMSNSTDLAALGFGAPFGANAGESASYDAGFDPQVPSQPQTGAGVVAGLGDPTVNPQDRDLSGQYDSAGQTIGNLDPNPAGSAQLPQPTEYGLSDLNSTTENRLPENALPDLPQQSNDASSPAGVSGLNPALISLARADSGAPPEGGMVHPAWTGEARLGTPTQRGTANSRGLFVTGASQPANEAFSRTITGIALSPSISTATKISHVMNYAARNGRQLSSQDASHLLQASVKAARAKRVRELGPEEVSALAARALRLRDKLMLFGVNRVHADALAANAAIESHANFQLKQGRHGPGYGLWQWGSNDPKMDRRLTFHRVMGKSIYNSTEDDQIRFMIWELTHTERGRWAAARAGAKDAGDVAKGFALHVEGMRDKVQDPANRAAVARALSAMPPAGSSGLNFPAVSRNYLVSRSRDFPVEP
jgi:hypothetical protein